MLCCGLFYTLLTVVAAHPAPGFPGEVAEGCGTSVDFASHPAQRARTEVRDAQDFLQFPDKSKQEQRTFSTEAVAQFDGEDGRPLYLIIDGKVYDFTDFADLHPAGPEPLKTHAGHDATAAMRAAGMPAVVFTDFIKLFRVGQIEDS